MLKNVDRLEMHLKLPPGGIVWMVLVGGKTIPVIQHNDFLTITLIRSTLTGENIAFPVEIVYMIPEPMDELEFMIPQPDVSILNLKVNIGLPSSIYIEDPAKYNPLFEIESWDKWRSKKKHSGTTSEDYLDFMKATNTKLSEVSYDKNINEPDLIYIGLDEEFGVSNTIEIERLDSVEGELDSYGMEIDNFDYNPYSQIKYAKISLTQGQYEIRNSGVKRQITVMGGATQQVIFDSDEELVFTNIPPIYLQFPKSGQIIRLSAIFMKPNENTSIILIEGEPEELDLIGQIKSTFGSICFLQLLIVFIIILDICITYYVLKIRPKKKESEKSQKKNSNVHQRSNHLQKRAKRKQKRKIEKVEKK